MLIGNDLVDLRAREAQGKAGDERFVRRVFTPAEAAWIRDAPDPDLALWMLWAAKEAAYKVAKKMRPDVPFALKRFEVAPSVTAAAALADPAVARGCVHVAALSDPPHGPLPVTWELKPSFVHCIARERSTESECVWASVASQDTLLETVAEADFTEREHASARSRESVAVRRLAKRLAREAGLGEIEIVRAALDRRLGPPHMHRPGDPERIPGWDLSLSHDGDLVAAALCRATGTARE